MKIETLWFVTNARKDSTLEDIFGKVTPIQLERQFKGGLRVDVDEVALYDNEAEALADANDRLLIARVSDPKNWALVRKVVASALNANS